MKFNKIFALGVAALTMTACSDYNGKYTESEHDFNTAAGVTVSMEETSVSVKENVGLFNVPVVVNGDANGYVEVKVKVTDGTVSTATEEPAIADAHYYVTSKTIYIPADSKTGNIEISSVDFRLPQKTRSFTITIEDVKGATLSGNATTTVYILDKGTSPAWSELAGEWMVTGNSYTSSTGEYDNPFSYRGQFTVTDDAKMEFKIPGFDGYAFMAIPFVYDYDSDINYGDIAVPLGGLVGSNINFGEPIGAADLKITLSTGTAVGTVSGQWNDNYTAVSFGNTEFLIGIYNAAGNTGYYYSRFNELTLTHISK